MVGPLKLLPASVAGWADDCGPADEPGWPAGQGLGRPNRTFDCTPLELIDLVVLDDGALAARSAAARASAIRPRARLADLLAGRGAAG